MQVVVSSAPPIAVPDGWRPGRAVIVFEGVEQAGPSFEGRVYLGNPAADEHTGRDASAGYAGSFHVFGYGRPEPPGMAAARADRPGETVAPIEKRVEADQAALRSAASGDAITVTVVAVPADATAPPPPRLFESVRIEFD